MGRRHRTARRLTAALGVLVTVVALAACGSGKPSTRRTAAGTLVVGTAARIRALDPAGGNDPGSLLIENNIYQYLLRVPPGGGSPQPDAADTCRFTTHTQYTCSLRSALNFSNGDTLTATDVAFSFNRLVRLADRNGPSALLDNMGSVRAANLSTVVFTLKRADDPTWPFVLASAAGAIVDSKVFPANALLSDSQVIGSGPYAVSQYVAGQSAVLTANSVYAGSDRPRMATVDVRYYPSTTTLRADLQRGTVDVAVGGLSPADVTGLSRVPGLTVLSGHGSEVRALGFGAASVPGSSATQRLAVRQAVAYTVDRQKLVTVVFHDAAEPAYSIVPPGVGSATNAFKDAFGGAPDVDKARTALRAAGVPTPVAIGLAYPAGEFGSESSAEITELARQLDGTGLFDVNVDSVSPGDFAKGTAAGSYASYQYVLAPNVADPDAYVSTVLSPKDSGDVAALLKSEQTSGGGHRADALAELQKIVATEVGYLPLVSVRQVAVVHGAVSGMQDTLDVTGQIRLWLVGRG